MTTRKQTIEQALSEIYGDAMVPTVADHIDQRWTDLVKEGERNNGLEAELTIAIWNWYAGGTTAAKAARLVLERLEES